MREKWVPKRLPWKLPNASGLVHSSGVWGQVQRSAHGLLQMICNKSSLITKSERQEGGKLQRILQIEEDSYADITGNSQNGFKRKRSTCTAGSVLWVCLPSTEKKAAVDVNHRPLPFSTGRRPTSYSFLLVDVDRTFIGQNCTFHDLLYNKKCSHIGIGEKHYFYVIEGTL